MFFQEIDALENESVRNGIVIEYVMWEESKKRRT